MPPAHAPVAPARRPAGQRPGFLGRVQRALSNLLILSGLLLLLDAGLTLVWQEPVSAVYARVEQGSLARALPGLGDLTALQLQALGRLSTERRRVAFLADALERRVKPGDPIGRIRSRRMGIDVVVVRGTDGQTLRKGPGHYPDTELPGQPGTVAIAGHRTTYGAPFRQIHRMRPGDPIEVETPYGLFVYRVELKRIVKPNAYDYVTRDVGHDRLALTACHPLYSAAERIVVFARLDSVRGRGSAEVASSLAPGRVGVPPDRTRPYWPGPR